MHGRDGGKTGAREKLSVYCKSRVVDALVSQMLVRKEQRGGQEAWQELR